MPAASAGRVLLAPPEAWDEERLMDAVRALPERSGPLRPGDELGGLVVLAVEPSPGAAIGDATVLDVRPRPRPSRAPLVDVAVLLDRSESMGLPWSADLSRAEAALESLSSFLRGGARGVGRVSVFSFSKEPRLLAGPAPPEGLAFQPPEPSGPARTGAALDAALAHLAAEARDDRLQSILLLADGVGEEKATRAAAERAGRLGIPIHGLVFAPEADPLFEETARRSRGSAQVATLPLTLDFIHGSDAP